MSDNEFARKFAEMVGGKPAEPDEPQPDPAATDSEAEGRQFLEALSKAADPVERQRRNRELVAKLHGIPEDSHDSN